MKHWDEYAGVSLSIGIAALVALQFFVQAGYWFKVPRFDVLDGRNGAEVTIDFNRTIRREFEGAWRVEVRRETDAGWVSICSPTWQFQNYQPTTVLPIPVTLEWFTWTDPRCYELEKPGRYELVVTWLINPGSWLLEREIKRTDRFSILGEPT